VRKGFNASAFYEVLAEKLAARDMTWSALSRQTGVTSSTLSRMAQGRGPDAATLAVLSAWAGVNPADFVLIPLLRTKTEPIAEICTLLRADPNLAPEAAQALEAIVQITYERFRQPYV